MDGPTIRDAGRAFEAREAIRDRLPAARFPGGLAGGIPARPRRVASLASLAELADACDVFLLDAFGVLNVGDRAIPCAPERIAELRAAGKRVMVVSNVAGYPGRLAPERFRRLGFDFTPEELLSSREELQTALDVDAAIARAHRARFRSAAAMRARAASPPAPPASPARPGAAGGPCAPGAGRARAIAADAP